MNYQLRDTLYLPEGVSQTMQSFKVKRDGSTTKLKSRPANREPVGEVKSTPPPAKSSSHHSVVRQKSDLEKRRSGKQLADSSHGDSPVLSRQKSDTSRAIVKTPDYSNVKGSGYGVTATKPKREPSSGSLKGDEPKRSSSRLSTSGKDQTDVKTKLKREKSGDILGKATSLSPSQRKPTSKEDIKSGSTPSTLKRTGSGSKKVRTPSAEEDGAKGIDAQAAKKSDVAKGSPPSSLKLKRESRRSTETMKTTTMTTATTPATTTTASTSRKSTTPSTKSSTKK